MFLHICRTHHDCTVKFPARFSPKKTLSPRHNPLWQVSHKAPWFSSQIDNIFVAAHRDLTTLFITSHGHIGTSDYQLWNREWYFCVLHVRLLVSDRVHHHVSDTIVLLRLVINREKIAHSFQLLRPSLWVIINSNNSETGIIPLSALIHRRQVAAPEIVPYLMGFPHTETFRRKYRDHICAAYIDPFKTSPSW